MRVVKRSWRTSTTISLAGMAVPFGLGAAVSKGIYEQLIDKENVSYGHFLLFTGVAISITAFPVLARILTETKLLYTRVGVVVLAAGVGNDIVGWVLLALTVALANATSGVVAVYILLCAVGWTLFLFIGIKPVFIWLARRTGSLENGPTQVMITITLLLVLLSAWMTDIIGVHPIFGAFLVGLMVPHEGGYAVAMTEKIEDLVSVIFLPLYFALSGLKTNLGDLNSGVAWGYTVAVIVIAFVSKFGGCAGAAKLCGFNLRESAAIGTLMSCKGLVELIVLNIGLSAGILNTQTFSMFVLMAVVLTLVTTPLTLWIYPEQHRVAASEDDKPSQPSITKPHQGGPYNTDVVPAPSVAGKRLLVVLTSFDHLTGLMSFVRLLRPTQTELLDDTPVSDGLRRGGGSQARQSHSHSHGHSTRVSSDEKGQGGGLSRSSSSSSATSAALPASSRSRQTPPISIDALRLVELTDRTSAVMKVAEKEDTLRADPISNFFRTFSHLNHVPVESRMSVVSTEWFPSTIAARAKSASSDMVILPWTMPAVSHAAQQQLEQSQGLVAALSNPFETIFGQSSTSAMPSSSSQPHLSTNEFMKNLYQHAVLARKLIQNAECDVGLLVDRAVDGGLTAMASSRQHILLGFMGGPDDRVALNFVARLCLINTELKVTVLQLERSDDDAGGALPSVPATLHPRDRSVSNSNLMQDTIYRSHFSADNGHRSSPLQAKLQDNVAIEALQNAPQYAAAIAEERLVFESVSCARPLQQLLFRIEDEKPSLVVVGRGRKNPTMGSHRDELRVLLSFGLQRPQVDVNGTGAADVEDSEDAIKVNSDQSGDSQTPTSPLSAAAPVGVGAGESTTRLINSDACKVVGEVAFAIHAVLGAAGSNDASSAAGRKSDRLVTSPTLVIASSLASQAQSSTRHAHTSGASGAAAQGTSGDEA